MTAGFLEQPPITPEAQAIFDDDLKEIGYVMNGSRLWAYQPDTVGRLFGLMSQAFRPSGLGFRQRAILVASVASALGDSCCSLAWVASSQQHRTRPSPPVSFTAPTPD